MSSLTNWSVQYLFETSFTYNDKYKLVAIGDFLVRNKTQVDILDGVEYQRVTIRMNNLGVLERDREVGEKIGTKKQFRISEGQFLLSKIDARNGAFGVVPKELEGAIITGNYWTFDIDKQKINPYFLALTTTTPEFIRFCENASNGTTNRHYLQEAPFLQQKIPLPSLAEQNRIVNAYNEKIREAERLERLSVLTEVEVEEYLSNVLGVPQQIYVGVESSLRFVKYSALDRWDGKKDMVFKSDFPVLRMKKLIRDISTGTTPSTSRDDYFKDGDVSFYTPSDLGANMYLENAERKVTQLAVDEGKARVFKKGTLLFVGIGSTVGKVGLVNEELVSSNQQITGIMLDEGKLIPEFAYYYFYYFKRITTMEKTQSTIPIVNQSKILNISVPLPPVHIQEDVVNRIMEMREQSKQSVKQSHDLRVNALKDFEQEIFG